MQMKVIYLICQCICLFIMILARDAALMVGVLGFMCMVFTTPISRKI